MVNEPQSFHAGYVALVGRPNAGKSTAESFVGEKIAAVSTSRKPPFKILASSRRWPIVLVDTPGVTNLV
jgi:GTP-binding protein Era